MSVTAFLTDSTLCIGCKACEVACKEWNGVAERRARLERILLRQHGRGGSFDVAAREICGAGAGAGLRRECGGQLRGLFLPMSASTARMRAAWKRAPQARSCARNSAACLSSPMCATAAAICVVSCPFGVVERNQKDGRAFKCTFCYDRQKVGLQPACAKACPTESIKFGEIEH